MSFLRSVRVCGGAPDHSAGEHQKDVFREPAPPAQSEEVGVRAGRFALEALVVDGRPNLRGTQAFKDGLFEVQDEASQLIAELVEQLRSGLVLDYCAGAGGKTPSPQDCLVGPSIVQMFVNRLSRKPSVASTRSQARHDALSWPQGAGDPSRKCGPGARGRAVHRTRAPATSLSTSGGCRVRVAKRPSGRRGSAQARRWVQPGGRLITPPAPCSVRRTRSGGELPEESGLKQISVREILGRSRSRVFEKGHFFRSYPHLHQTDGLLVSLSRHEKHHLESGRESVRVAFG